MMVFAIDSKKRALVCVFLLCASTHAAPPWWQHVTDGFWTCARWIYTSDSPISGVPASREQMDVVCQAQRMHRIAPDACLPVVRASGAQRLIAPSFGLTTEHEIAIAPEYWETCLPGFKGFLALHEACHVARDDCQRSSDLSTRYDVVNTALEAVVQVPAHLLNKHSIVTTVAVRTLIAATMRILGHKIIFHSYIWPLWCNERLLDHCLSAERFADAAAARYLGNHCKQCIFEVAASERVSEAYATSHKSFLSTFINSRANLYFHAADFTRYQEAARDDLCEFHRIHALRVPTSGFVAIAGSHALMCGLSSSIFNRVSDFAYYPIFALVWVAGRYLGLSHVPLISDIGLGFVAHCAHRFCQKLALYACGPTLEPTVRWLVTNFLWCNQCLNEAAQELEARPDVQEQIGYSPVQLRERAKQIMTLCPYHAVRSRDGQAVSAISQTFWMRELAHELENVDSGYEAVRAFERDEKPRILRL